MSVADKAAPLAALSAEALRPRRTVWQWLLYISRRDARIPSFTGLMLLLLTLSLLAPVIAPFDPAEPNTNQRLQGPSREHLLGTDQLGRDTFTRVLYGGRVTLPAGLTVVAIAAGVGVVLGVLAGFFGGILDLAIGRWVDAQIAFPSLLLLIALINAFGAKMLTVMIVVGLVNFPGYFRLTRGQVLQVREFDYVNAARALGASTPRLMFRHVLPNSLNPLIIQTSLAAGGAVLLLSNLSFLGLAPKSRYPDWGAMFLDALTNFRLQPWLVLGPGLAVFVTVLSFYMLGDALRDIIDPRMRGAKH